jgi:hypothetical protein
MKSLTPEDGYAAALAVKGSDFCPSYWKYPAGSIRKKISGFLKRFNLFGKIVNFTCLPSNPPESNSSERNCFFEWRLLFEK